MQEVAKLETLQNPTTSRSKDMPFLHHLDELRFRLVRILIAVGIAFLFTCNFSKEIFQFLIQPLLHQLGEKGSDKLFFTGLTEPFLIDLKVALFAALFFSCPIIFFQIWRFVAPGLRLTEKRLMLTLVFFSSTLFVLGMSFAYFIVMPFSFRFFLSFTTENIRPIITIGDYLGFCTQTMLGFGIIFELPLFVVILSLAGVLNAKKIAGFWRYVVIGIALISAALTPPDVASMMFMMVPLLLLYGLSILLSALCSRKPPSVDSNPLK